MLGHNETLGYYMSGGCLMTPLPFITCMLMDVTKVLICALFWPEIFSQMLFFS